MQSAQPGGSPLFGLDMPHPDEAKIRAQNAQRVSHRAAIASLASSVAQTGQGDLGRGPRRQVGGTFESLQAIPDRITPAGSGLNQSDLAALFQAFTIQGSTTGGQLHMVGDPNAAFAQFMENL